MRGRDLFALGVRLLGAWLICRGAVYVAGFADAKLYPATTRGQDGAAGHLIYATIDFALAALFLLWTRLVVDCTYGDESMGGASGDGVEGIDRDVTDPR